DRLVPVPQQAEQGERRDRREERDRIVRYELLVHERRRRGHDRGRDRRSERKPPAREEGQDHAQDCQDVEPERAVGPVVDVLAENGLDDPDDEGHAGQRVEPVAAGERPEPIPELKVLQGAADRLVREDETDVVHTYENRLQPGATRSPRRVGEIDAIRSASRAELPRRLGPAYSSFAMFSRSSSSGASTASHASTISRAVSGGVRLRLITRTFASFQRRAPSAIHGSQASAARTPGTLFAAIAVPVPVQQKSSPWSARPSATARATLAATSGHWSRSSTSTACPCRRSSSTAASKASPSSSAPATTRIGSE